LTIIEKNGKKVNIIKEIRLNVHLVCGGVQFAALGFGLFLIFDI
jgi:hypothetical protein